MTNDEGSPKDRMTRGIAERLPPLYFLVCHSALICHSSFVFRHFSRVPEHLLEGSVAGEDAAQAVLAQSDHSKLDSLLFNRNRGCTVIDHLAKRIGDLQKLVDSFSSFVARVVTGVATFAVEEFLVTNVLPRESQLRK